MIQSVNFDRVLSSFRTASSFALTSGITREELGRKDNLEVTEVPCMTLWGFCTYAAFVPKEGATSESTGLFESPASPTTFDHITILITAGQTRTEMEGVLARLRSAFESKNLNPVIYVPHPEIEIGLYSLGKALGAGGILLVVNELASGNFRRPFNRNDLVINFEFLLVSERNGEQFTQRDLRPC